MLNYIKQNKSIHSTIREVIKLIQNLLALLKPSVLRPPNVAITNAEFPL